MKQIISGDTKGILYHHLRASRELINSLFSRNQPAHDRQSDHSILGLCLELYAYILITNSFKPRGIGPGCSIAYDPFVMCLGNLDTFTTFGTMFGNRHGLFQLIPKITLFAGQRLLEEQTYDSSPSGTSCSLRALLEAEIENWRPDHPDFEDEDAKRKADAAAEAMRSALQIYLATAFAGSLVSDPQSLAFIQLHIDSIISAVHVVAESRFATILLWPLLVAGSCMTDSGQQSQLVAMLKASRYRMKHVFAVCDVLEQLWATQSPYAYGPYGLFLMEQRGFSIPML